MHHAVFDADGFGAGVEQVTGELLHLGREQVRSHDRGAPRNHPLAAACRAGREAPARTVALENGDVLVSHAEPLGNDLRHGRCGAVALRMRAHRRGDLAGRLDADLRKFARHRRDAAGGPRRFDVGRNPESEVATFLARGFLLFAKGGDVEVLEQLIEAFGRRDVLERNAHARGGGLILQRDQIAAADLDRIDADAPSGHIQRGFADERFHRPGSAIGGKTDRVGVPAARQEAIRRHLVGRPQEHLDRDIAIRQLRIGAVVAAVVAVRSDQPAVGVERHLQHHFRLARLVGGDQVLVAILDPFQRPTEFKRRENDRRPLPSTGGS